MEARTSVTADQARGCGSFLEHLVRCLKDADGGLDPSVPDVEVLGPLVARASAPRVGRVDPEVFWRIEAFFRAVGARIEERTGVTCLTMMRMRGEGFGTVVLLAGRLVAVSRSLRDAGAFHFDSLEAIAAEGERLVHEGVEMVGRHPALAHAAR